MFEGRRPCAIQIGGYGNGRYAGDDRDNGSHAHRRAGDARWGALGTSSDEYRGFRGGRTGAGDTERGSHREARRNGAGAGDCGPGAPGGPGQCRARPRDTAKPRSGDGAVPNAELRRAKSVAEQIGAAASATGEIAIRSPLNGVVLARTAVPGTVVEAGTPLVVVTDPSTLWLSIDAPENLASLFSVGAQLRFTVPAYPADTFSARIDAVGAGLDPSTRTLPIRAVIRNRDDRLKPEMLASVSAQGGGAISAPSVPEDAVQLLDGKSVVFVAHPDSMGGAHFVPRDVQLGSRSGGRIAITQGLAPGDLVVTRGALAIKAQIKKGAMPAMEM
ncbi:MAG: hypothetical protein DMF96_29690 [Acidobacteria bacterium]|nr:MAG: hypothetical protein DMF96_29690 [Acidobacteriota bacterium]